MKLKIKFYLKLKKQLQIKYKSKNQFNSKIKFEFSKNQIKLINFLQARKLYISMNVGINGFGRIGRAMFRLISKNKDINVSVINDINPDIKNICYTLQYDIHGTFKDRVHSKNNEIIEEK